MAGTILSVTVPEMTTRSAWRGLAGSGMTPRRITSYRGEPNAAPISIAQQARPHWYTHSEYLRLTLRRLVRGLGMRPFSMRPISPSHPSQDSLAPRVDQAEHQHEDEQAHLGQPEAAVHLELRGPR